jgi:hypothetical protein
MTLVATTTSRERPGPDRTSVAKRKGLSRFIARDASCPSTVVHLLG